MDAGFQHETADPAGSYDSPAEGQEGIKGSKRKVAGQSRPDTAASQHADNIASHALEPFCLADIVCRIPKGALHTIQG
jgi:hypothetical protein